MRISLVSPNLSSNSLARTYLLALLLLEFSEVEILGPIFGKNIWPPLRDQKDILIKPIKAKNFATLVRRLKPLVEGDIIYVSKPLLTSLGVTFLAEFENIMVDIDDWELGLLLDNVKRSILKSPFYMLPHPFNEYNSLPDCFILEQIVRSLEVKITVSNSFLQRKFGGTIIWHTRDENVFDPKKYDSLEERREFGIPDDKTVVLFFGTPRPHKGLEELIKGVYKTKELVNNRDFLLVIGGIGKDNYSKKIVNLGKSLLKEKVLFIGHIQFKDIPRIVATADIYVIPQKKSPASIGQMPAKLFDAMAMAKPVVSTSISDIPKILENVGIVISPEPSELEKQIGPAISYLVENPNEALSLGRKARKIFVAEYGFKAMRKRLKKLLLK